MKISLFCPLGSTSAESGLMFVLARYLVALGHEVVELRCNGCLSICDRDAENDWKRPVEQCAGCEAESKQLGAWAGTAAVELSDCTSAEMLKSAQQTLFFKSSEELWDLSLGSGSAEKPGPQFSVAQAVLPTFQARFSREQPDFKNRLQEQFVRKLALEAFFVARAVDRFIGHVDPNLCLVSGANNYVARVASLQLKRLGQRSVSFSWQLADRSIRLTPSWNSEYLLCSLLLERITAMRNDTKTWPSELLSVLKEISALLGIDRNSVTPESPIAHNA